MNKKASLAVVGATGVVGESVLDALADSTLEFDEVFAVASAESFGETLHFQGRDLSVRTLDDFDFSQVDISIFAVPDIVADRFIPRAVAKGNKIVRVSQLSNGDSMMPGCEWPEDAQEVRFVTPAFAILKPLLQVFEEEHGIAAVDATLLQPAAARGRAGVEELAQQTIGLFNNQDIEIAAFPVRAAFNAIPQVGLFNDEGDTQLEAGLLADIQQHSDGSEMALSATAVQVPVFYGTAIKLVIDLCYPVDANTKLTDLIDAHASLKRIDEAKAGGYMTPIDVIGKSSIYVSRLKQVSATRFTCWLTADSIALTAKSVVNLLDSIKD
ncbi:Asd/ArgC dimerization domain-containing protein [Leeia oryzae]|uniref:Asd/ArgC dimerization domain-containing protein n=1 Tax=Leeia oryzae TaxID=356662 RepID=UPI000374BAB2|nr:Asd/ArgC dimerization domain-containing protein [Leeia oryzae]